MKLINKLINWIKSLFLTKKQKQFAKEALDSRTIHKHNQKIQRSYFKKLPRRTGFKKTPSIAHKQGQAFDIDLSIRPNFVEVENPEPKKKKAISKELQDKRELAQAKRSFFIELISARAKEIQRPFIKEKLKKKAARKSSKKIFQFS